MGFYYAIVIFCSVGILVGVLGYQLLKKNEYYTYYNLGLTKVKLLKKVLLLNLSICIPLTIIYMIVRWIF